MKTARALPVALLACAAVAGCGGTHGDPGGSDSDPLSAKDTSDATHHDAGAASEAAATDEPPPASPDDCPADKPLFDGAAPACLAPSEAEAACKDEAAKLGNATDDPSCGAGCTCQACTQEMLDCGADPEGYCATLLTCATEHGCTGVGCYAPDTCQQLIDDAPGGGLTSLSVALATAVSDCADAASCASSCP